MSKKFVLRIMSEKVYPKLEKTAKAKYISVNTLINTIIEDSLKKDKKDLVVSN